MFNTKILSRFLAVAMMLSPLLSVAASNESLQQEIDQLKVQNASIIMRLDASMDLLESQTRPLNNTANKTSLHGYAELHYNNIKDKEAQVDFHRFVLEIEHEFNDSIRFFSELELEHSIAGHDQVGEFELEQAFVQIDVDNNSAISVGLILLPIGIINETHEPPAFYGVERNLVEKNIIPASWWEAGVMYSANNATGISYDLAIHSGLAVNGTAGDAKFGDIRSGRQKVAKAGADELAATFRIKYTGIAGLELASSLHYQSDITQSRADAIDDATLIEAHAIWNQGAFTAKALAADWSLNGNNLAKLKSQSGNYIEVSYKLNEKTGVFTRASTFDYQKKGSTSSSYVNNAKQTDLGLNYWVHEDVVFKFDYQLQNNAAGDSDGFNLGLGLRF